MIDYSVQPTRTQRPIDAEPFHRYIFDDGTVWTEFYRNDDGYLLRFPDLADFEVTADGKAVRGYPTEDVDEVTLEHLYINQLVPLALSRQGRPSFHASVVTVNGGCVAFLGKTGMGKSTLAASFALEDAAFLTDDSLIISESDGVRAMPSHASVRLWEDSVEALVDGRGQAASNTCFVSYSSKARLLAGEALRHLDEPARLLAAFELRSNDVEAIEIAPLEGSERHMAWIGNSFLLDIVDKELLARHFDWTHRIADRVPTFSLDYPREYGILPRVRDAVRRQAKAVGN